MYAGVADGDFFAGGNVGGFWGEGDRRFFWEGGWRLGRFLCGGGFSQGATEAAWGTLNTVANTLMLWQALQFALAWAIKQFFSQISSGTRLKHFKII